MRLSQWWFLFFKPRFFATAFKSKKDLSLPTDAFMTANDAFPPDCVESSELAFEKCDPQNDTAPVTWKVELEADMRVGCVINSRQPNECTPDVRR